MRCAAALTTMLLAAALPAVARAEVPATPATPTPTPAASVPSSPAQATQTTLKLKIERIGGTRRTALAGSRIRVRGSVGAYMPGQTVTVRFVTSGRKGRVKRVALLPGATGGGAFRLSHRLERPGLLLVRASHAATPELGTLTAVARTVDVLPRRVGPRSGRRSVRMLQRRLRRLGYVTGEPGAFDGRTARAIIAFRKLTGMRRTATASLEVMRALARGAGRFRVRHPEHGRHIEADLSRQVLALVNGRRVERIYPTSSGAPVSPTVIGSFRVYLKTPGTNAKGMVHSAYFIRGYATHGYWSVPVYPASHGCLRVPIPDALSIFNWITLGTPVDVYR